MNLVSEQIEQYAALHSSPEAALFREMVRETRKKTDAPQMQVGHLEGNFLRLLARLSNAKRILEIGTFTGYSALCMAEALPEDGCLITCDVDAVTSEMAKRFWAQSSHGKKIQLRLGPAIEIIKNLNEVFDMAFIDADKENYIAYWDAIITKLRPGGLIAVDNVLWSGRVLKPKEASDRAIHAFNEHAMRDGRVDLVMLTVRDGITLAVKK